MGGGGAEEGGAEEVEGDRSGDFHLLLCTEEEAGMWGGGLEDLRVGSEVGGFGGGGWGGVSVGSRGKGMERIICNLEALRLATRHSMIAINPA